MNTAVDNNAQEPPRNPGNFTKVSVETQAGELEARLSEYGTWEVRIRQHHESTWKHACSGDLSSGHQTMLPVAPKSVEPIIRGPILIDVAGRRVSANKQECPLSQKEFALLLALAQDPEQVWTKSQLMKAVWGYENNTGNRTLDSHASRLRVGLRRAGVPEMVINVWGVGYKLWDRLDPDAPPPATTSA
jgi:DNA-binding response OmpR family regulator